MNIFDLAMELEKEGEALYRKFSADASPSGMARIFSELADQEQKHYDIFKRMKGHQDAALAETSFLPTVKSIFASWQQNKEKFNFNMSQTDLYRKALDVEQKSIDFYMEQSTKVTDARQGEILKKIADEERNHYAIMTNIVEFMTTPERWVEHAEFSKIGEEY